MTGIERLVDIVNDGPYSGGMIHISVQKLREICEQIEREVDDISGHESDVLAFVEEQGGIEVIKERLLEIIPHAVYDRIYRRKNRRIRELENELEDMRGRLIPEGMEWLLEVWPKWSNGEYCKFGDWWTAKKYGDYEPKKLLRLVIYTPEQLSKWEQGDGEPYGYEWDFMRPSEVGYRPDKADQPSQQIIAADGKPLESGQTVWDVNTGDEFEVCELIQDDVVEVVVEYMNCGVAVHGRVNPETLTHKRPVLDANGVPIKKGDTVWHKGTGEKYRVFRFSDEEDRVWGESDLGSFFLDCSMLTHTKPEPPDSAERIAEDIMRMAEEWCSYPTLWEASEKAASSVREATMGVALRSLSKRCRALDERERGE